jgi:hypothetical protein
MTEHSLDNGTAWTKLNIRHGVHLKVDRSAMEGIAERLLIDKKVVREVIRELNLKGEGEIEDEIIFFHDDDGFRFQIGKDD